MSTGERGGERRGIKRFPHPASHSALVLVDASDLHQVGRGRVLHLEALLMEQAGAGQKKRARERRGCKGRARTREDEHGHSRCV